MEIWECFQILRAPKKGWFYTEKYIDKKLKALGEISMQGKIRDVIPLADLLKHDHKAIREAACNTIIYLFKKAATKNEYYDALKYCPITLTDIDHYTTNFSGETSLQLLAICSFNGNGYVREKAVRLLSAFNDPKAIPFLVYRLADWVPAVRTAAMQSIVLFKQPGFVNALIENLTLFDWLQRVERASLHEIYQEIIDYLIKENRRIILENFSTYPEKIRVLLSKHISKSLSDDPKELSILLSDKHFLVRLQAVEHFDRLPSADVERLLNDESAKVRLQTLCLLKGRDDFNDILLRFLADSAANIRHFARYWLRDTVKDLSAIYHQHILNNRQVGAAITGLAELNDKRHTGLIASFLENGETKIRKVAFLALTKLDIETAYQFAINNMDSELPGLRKLIVHFLPHASRKEMLVKARTCFQNGDDEVRKSMLSLFDRVGGWPVIADLLLGLIDNNGHIRQQSHDAVQRWRSRAIHLFMRPEQADVDRANQMIGLVAEIAKEKGFYYGRTLEEVAFLLK